MQTITLYVPRPGATALSNIRPASAIVGSPSEGVVRIDYEGNAIPSEAHRTYEGRVNSAAGRHVNHYPTSARSWVLPEHLIAVGTATFLPKYGWFISEITDAAALQAWLGDESLPPLGGSQEFRSRAASLYFRHMRPAAFSKMHAHANATGKSLIDVIFEHLLAESARQEGSDAETTRDCGQ